MKFAAGMFWFLLINISLSADVPCNKAKVWAYHGTCDANNSNPGICQIAYDELKAIDSDEHDRDFWRTMFFGSIEEFNQQCNN